MRALCLAVFAIGTCGCGAITHPRESPVAANARISCERVLIVPAAVKARIKNFLVNDYFEDERRGGEYARFFANAAWRALSRKGRHVEVRTTLTPEEYGAIRTEPW